MEQFFERLRAIIDASEKELSEKKGPDVIFGLGDLGEALNDAISGYSEAVQADVDEGGDGQSAELPEPVYVPNIAVLTQAAVRGLAIRGDLVAQLKEDGAEAEAAEVAAYLASVADPAADAEASPVSREESAASSTTTTSTTSGSIQSMIETMVAQLRQQGASDDEIAEATAQLRAQLDT